MKLCLGCPCPTTNSLSRLTSFAIAFALALRLRSSGISRRVGTCAREFSFWSLFLVWLILEINFHSVINVDELLIVRNIVRLYVL